MGLPGGKSQEYFPILEALAGQLLFSFPPFSSDLSVPKNVTFRPTVTTKTGFASFSGVFFSLRSALSDKEGVLIAFNGH